MSPILQYIDVQIGAKYKRFFPDADRNNGVVIGNRLLDEQEVVEWRL
jgi:hypothetical protein